jgi:hypothetical protein
LQSVTFVSPYAVYEPDAVYVRIVFAPLVVTVGEPVVVPEYLAVGIERITTPEPPAAPLGFGVYAPPPPPPPVFVVPATDAVPPDELLAPLPPPPEPPEPAVPVLLFASAPPPPPA